MKSNGTTRKIEHIKTSILLDMDPSCFSAVENLTAPWISFSADPLLWENTSFPIVVT